jgi:hypothetical protein
LEREPSKMSIRKTGLYIGAGVLAAIMIISGLTVAGINFPAIRLPGFPSNKGTLAVLLTDAPVELEHLNVTLDKVQVQMEAGGNDTWTTLPFVNGVSNITVDILRLNNVTQDLSVSEVPVGNYTKIRLDILNATATYANGTVQQLRVPSGHIDIIIHFQVKSDVTTKVLIDMTADFVAISHSGNLRPVLKAKVIP